MKRSFLPILIPLLFILVTSACGPAVQQEVLTSTATLISTNQETTQVPINPTAEVIATETSQPETLIQPTSRGPNLEASDPSLVNLASGQLQLVEFFRFT
ncbi:MAG TPA: hypothetical protein VJZ78_01945 [Anaerolineales bacterium]|nr:hypothetical protein [Anaerolineales bacterium]